MQQVDVMELSYYPEWLFQPCLQPEKEKKKEKKLKQCDKFGLSVWIVCQISNSLWTHHWKCSYHFD